MVELGQRELSGRVIEAAIAVHTALGPGFIESVYESALCLELTARRISSERQKIIMITYRGNDVGQHRLDLVVDKVLLVELNAVRAIKDIFFAVGRSHLRAAGLADGIILNFAAMPLGIKRIGPGLASS